MRLSLRKFIFGVCIFGLGLIAVCFLNRAPTLSEAMTREEPVPTVLVAVAESSLKRSARSQLPKLPSGPEAAPEPATTGPLELPEDPDQLREWARQNPEEALVWLRTAVAGEARDTVVEMVCARVAESHPAEAVSLAERYSGGCSNLLENLVHQWADQNEPAAMAYALSKPPGEERDRLLSRVALTRSKEDPADAAKLVVEWISPGAVQNEAAMSVLHQWGLRDPKAALAWAQLFPEESLRDRALTEMWNIFSPGKE